MTKQQIDQLPLDQLPPHSIEAEEAVLGSILLLHERKYCPLCARPHDVQPKELFNVFSYLKPSDFFREKNAWIFQAMLDLHREGNGIDEIIVAHKLKSKNQLDEIYDPKQNRQGFPSPAYFYHLLAAVPTSMHMEHYAKIVLDCSRRRQLIVKAGQMAKDAYSNQNSLAPFSKGPIDI